MTIEEQVQNHETRIKALEAKQGTPLKMGDGIGPDDLFGGKAGTGAPPPPPTDPNYLVTFGRVFGEGGRLMTKAEESTWNRRKKSWGGSTAMPDSDAVDALLDYYTLRGDELQPEAIVYGGSTALVFRDPGMGYGTPQCFVLSVSAIEQAYGEAHRLDRLVEQIDQKRAK